jgi:hypothetical protein
LPSEQAARLVVAKDDEVDHQRNRQRDVGERRLHVGALALVGAKQCVGDLEVRERPEPEHRDVEQRRRVRSEQRARERAGQGDAEQGGDRRRDERQPDRAGGDPVAALAVVVVVVEADERLADAEAQHDREQDHGGQQRLGVAVLRRRHVARIERQREERRALREDVARLVGETRGDEPLQIGEHVSPAPAAQSGARGERSADRQQHPGRRVLEEVRVEKRVHDEAGEGGGDREPRHPVGASGPRQQPPPNSSQKQARSSAT